MANVVSNGDLWATNDLGGNVYSITLPTLPAWDTADLSRFNIYPGFGVDAAIGGWAPTPTVVAPTITVPPVSTTLVEGATVSFSVTATENPSYEWQKNGTVLSDGGRVSGATSSTLTITGALTSDQATYTVRAYNGTLPDATADATLTVNNRPEDLGRGSSSSTVGQPSLSQNSGAGTGGEQLPRKGNLAGDVVDNTQSNNPVNEQTDKVYNREGSAQGKDFRYPDGPSSRQRF
jgi:hypothetical protein